MATTAGNAGLHSDAVADFQCCNLISYFVYDAGGFVAEDHGVIDNEGADAAVDPVVHIRAADTGPFGLDENIVLGLQFGDWAVLICEVVDLLEDEGGVLCSSC